MKISLWQLVNSLWCLSLVSRTVIYWLAYGNSSSQWM